MSLKSRQEILPEYSKRKKYGKLNNKNTVKTSSDTAVYQYKEECLL